MLIKSQEVQATGRPRKYVQTNGKEITGVSRMPDSRFYIIDDDNRRRYFRNVEDARAAYLASQSRDLSPMERAVLIAKTKVWKPSACCRKQRIRLLGYGSLLKRM